MTSDIEGVWNPILIDSKGLTADGWWFFLLQAPFWIGATFFGQNWFLGLIAYGTIAIIKRITI